DTSRYKFRTKTKIIDLGLRLDDAEAMGLLSEPVAYPKCGVDPRINLLRRGASRREADFLVHRRTSSTSWVGERVELNAMTSQQFIEFLERKLGAHGVAKVIPDAAMLADAYRRAWPLAR